MKRYLKQIAFFGALIISFIGNVSVAQPIDVGTKFDLDKETVHNLSIAPIIFNGVKFQPEEYLEYFESGFETTVYLMKGIDDDGSTVLYAFSSEDQLNLNRLQILAKRFNNSNPDSFSDLDEVFDSLSNEEKYQVIELAKSFQPQPAVRNQGIDSRDNFRSEVFKKAVELADQRYGQFLPDLSESEIQSLLEEVISSNFPGRTLSEIGEDNQQQRASCSVRSYPNRIYYGSVSYKWNKPIAVRRTVNTAGESPCDFEVQFYYGYNRKIYSNSWYQRQLMSDSRTGFGGTMIARDNGRYVLFGYWRTVFWVGPAWYVENSFKRNMYAW